MGLTAALAAATSTAGAWWMWKLLIAKKHKRQGHGDDTICADSSSSSSSSFGEDEIEQVWTDNHNVDLKVFREIIEKKQAKKKQIPKAHIHSKLALFSHLISKLETTIDERLRMEEKLRHLRRQPSDDDKPTTGTTSTDTKAHISPVIKDSSSSSSTSVCMVVQRCRGATILVNENELVKLGANTSQDHSQSLLQGSSEALCGLLVYVSFAKGCTEQSVQLASKIIVNLPVLTTGAWGDGVSETLNVMDLAKKHTNAASIVLVPQANLINKVRSELY